MPKRYGFLDSLALQNELKLRGNALQDIYKGQKDVAFARWRAEVKYKAREGAEPPKHTLHFPTLNQQALDFYKHTKVFLEKLKMDEPAHQEKKVREAFIQSQETDAIHILTECKNLLVWDSQDITEITAALTALIYSEGDTVAAEASEMRAGK